MKTKKDWWTPRRRELYGRAPLPGAYFWWLDVKPGAKMHALGLNIENTSKSTWRLRFEEFDESGEYRILDGRQG